MSLRRRVVAPAAFILVTLAIATPATAYVRTTTCIPGGGINGCADGETPKPLYWPSSCVTFHINEDGTSRTNPERTFAALRTSFEAWNEVECSFIDLEFGGYTNETRVGYNPDSNNANITVFRDDDWEHSRGILALTSVTFKGSTGEIFDADIEFNSQAYNFTTTDNDLQVLIDVQNTATHEVGHFIGLDHSGVAESTMYATAPLKETKKRTLHQDDIDGLCEIYPLADAPANTGCWGAPVGFFERPLYGPGDDTPASNPPETCGCTTPARSSAMPWTLALLVAGLAIAVVQRRRQVANRA